MGQEAVQGAEVDSFEMEDKVEEWALFHDRPLPQRCEGN